MNCLKCGRDTKGEQIFCDLCLDKMDAYPVKSDAPIHLPTRSSAPPATKKAAPRKRALSSEELIQQLITTNRRLIRVILVLSLVLCLCAGGLAYFLLNTPQDTGAPVNSTKNYTYSPD